MWKKHGSVFQEHTKYIYNGIVKTSRVGTLQYADFVHEMHDLAKYFPSPLMKSIGFESYNWDFCDKEFNEDIIRSATEDGILTSIQDELEKNHEEYCSIKHEE